MILSQYYLTSMGHHAIIFIAFIQVLLLLLLTESMIKYLLINILMEESHYISVGHLLTLKVSSWSATAWLISSSTSLQRAKQPLTSQTKHEITNQWLHEAADRGVCCEINSERFCVSKAWIFLIIYSMKHPQGGNLERDRDQLLTSSLYTSSFSYSLVYSLPTDFFLFSLLRMTFFVLFLCPKMCV